MSTNSDLPPAYSTLHATTQNEATIEEAVPNCDDGAELLVNNSFEDKNTRVAFVQKVLAIKLLQILGVAMFMVSFVINNERYFHVFMDDNFTHLMVISHVAYIVTFALLICCDQARRQNPYRYIFLVAYPLSFAFLITVVSYSIAMVPVFLAWAYYCAAVFALLVYSVFALLTKLEFNTVYGIFLAFGVQIVMYAITVPFVYVNPFYVLYPTLVMSLEIIYVLCDLQAMTSKNYRTIITPDDFVDGATHLHIDHIYIFINFFVPKIRDAFEKCMN